MRKKAVIRKNRKIKKITRRRRKSAAPRLQKGSILTIDQVYLVINRIQITREEQDFIIADLDAIIAENIMRDAEILFTKRTSRRFPRCVIYSAQPAPIVPQQENYEDYDELPDEIIEDGQIFF